MFNFFWVNYSKSELFFYFNSYSSFKLKKNKKIFVVQEDSRKNFYNFKKYDINLKNSVSSRDIVIQHLFDSKFSTFVLFTKLILYFLMLGYAFMFLCYVLANFFFIFGFIIIFIINVALYLTFVLAFIVNFTAFLFVYLLLIFLKCYYLVVLLVAAMSLFNLNSLSVLFILLISLFKFFPSVIFLILFILFKMLILFIYVYMLFLIYSLTFLGFRANKNVLLKLFFLSKKVNFFFFIFLNQKVSQVNSPALFLYFFKSSFYFIFYFFKFLSYSSVMLIFKNNNASPFSSRFKAQFDFSNFLTVDNSRIAETSFLLKYNYLLMHKLKFQNFLWVRDYNVGCSFIKKMPYCCLPLQLGDCNFFVKNVELLQHPETVSYWKNFNKNVFVKPLLNVFFVNDMGQANKNSFVRNVTQSSTSSNFQYSTLSFKKTFQYNDILDFYLQNKSNLIFCNSLFNYNYKNGLSKKWDQSRYLFLLSDLNYGIVKNLSYAGGIAVFGGEYSLTYIL